MPRPNKPRTIGAEKAMRATVVRWLEDNERTPGWLARKMTEAGCPIGAQSAWKMLRHERTVYLNEMLAISAVTGLSIAELTEAPR